MPAGAIATRPLRKLMLVVPPMRTFRETCPQVFLPLGLAYLAAMVRERVQVQVLDALVEGFTHSSELDAQHLLHGLSIEQTVARILDAEPDLVGISCLFSNSWPVVAELCRRLKRQDPGLVIVTGGSYPTFLAEECLGEVPELDAVVMGEGEQAFAQLVDRLQQGDNWAGLDGLAWRTDSGRVEMRPQRWIENLDDIPFPARDLFPLALYEKVGIPQSFFTRSWRFAPMITSRGCPARCVFCCSARFWGGRIRYRSPDNVLAELDELVTRFGVEEIQFEDDNLTLDKKRAKRLFRGIIERGYRLRFNFPNGLSLMSLDEELVDLMARAGTYEVHLAFESGSQRVLRDIVRKPLDLERALWATRLIKQRGIRTNAFFIIGFPGESLEEIQQTFRFAREVDTDTAYFFVASMLPGTEMYNLAREQGLLRDDFSFTEEAYTRSPYRHEVFPSGLLEKLAAREMVSYHLRSFLRRPGFFLGTALGNLVRARPAYLARLMVRFLRRAI